MTDTSKRTRRSRRLTPVALVLITGLGIVACTTPDPGGPKPTKPTTPSTTPTPTTRPGQCHRGDYDTATLSGTKLRVTGTLPSMSQTVKLEPVTYVRQPEFWQYDLIVCDPPGAGLPATKPFDITEDVSGHLGTQGVVVVGANQKTQLPIGGTSFVGSWRVTGVSGGITGGVIPVVEGTSISLDLLRNNDVSGKACNSYGSTWSTGKGGLTFAPVLSTKMACPEPPGTMAQEQRYFAALALTRDAKVSGNQLSLLDEGGTAIVTAVRGITTGPGPR